MHCSHTTLAKLSGALWLAMGIYLLQMGINFLIAPNAAAAQPLLSLLSPMVGGWQMALVVIVAVALYVGRLKGKVVLSKAASKGIAHINTLPNPAPLQKLYTARYCLLLGVMVLLGMSMKFFGVPSDIRGAIDIAIGAALIHGSMVYFQAARKMNEAAVSAVK